ncbi:MAG: hypothetical protein ACRDTU_22790 [Micromonosporaceae bacterium]
MTRKLSISLPDDLADRLDELPPRHRSAYVADALRDRAAREDMRTVLAAAGHREYPRDPQGAALRLTAARNSVTTEALEDAYARLADAIGRPLDEVRAQFAHQSVAE